MDSIFCKHTIQKIHSEDSMGVLDPPTSSGYASDIITDTRSDDDDDLQRDIRGLFTRVNILARRFGKRSVYM